MFLSKPLEIGKYLNFYIFPDIKASQILLFFPTHRRKREASSSLHFFSLSEQSEKHHLGKSLRIPFSALYTYLPCIKSDLNRKKKCTCDML